MNKHKAVSIKLDLWEADRGVVTVYAADGDVWQLADDRLRLAALNEEGRLGYAKIDFTVTYDDGGEYSGRYDLRYHDKDFTGLLARHITLFCEWHGGRLADPWIGVPEYRRFMQRSRAEDVAYFARMLDEYEIGSEATPWPRQLPVRVPLYEQPVYVNAPSGRPVLTRFRRLCQPHREKREAAGETRFNPTRYDTDKKCDDCTAGDLIPGPGRVREVAAVR